MGSFDYEVEGGRGLEVELGDLEGFHVEFLLLAEIVVVVVIQLRGRNFLHKTKILSQFKILLHVRLIQVLQGVVDVHQGRVGGTLRLHLGVVEEVTQFCRGEGQSDPANVIALREKFEVLLESAVAFG